MIEQRGNSNSGMSNQEVFKMIDRYHAPDKVIQQTEVKVDAAETKIKSLETIMNLFLKGIINTQELESLKKILSAKDLADPSPYHHKMDSLIAELSPFHAQLK